MKILFATPIYPPEIGGPAIYSQKLEQGLIGKGHSVEIVSYRGLKRYPQPLRFFLYFLKLFKKALGCDVIYAFNLISCGLPACGVSMILGKKLFMRIGGDFLWERAVEAGRTKKPLREYYQDRKTLKEKFWIILMKMIFNKTGKIIFTSKFQRDIYLKFFGFDEKKAIIIGNPFPDARQSGDNLSVANYQLLFAGRLIKLKNIDFLIRAFETILSKTDKDLSLKIIGDGPERQNLNGKNIVFSPAVSHRDLLEEIKQSYLCILPSLTEITPNFALECLKLQKPILLTKETGYFETFKDDLIFIDPKNESDLAEKIIYLLDEGNYLSYIEKIKNIPTQRSWEDVVKEHEENFIYRSNKV
ncbi:MAG: glycosyltransferase family 4 protein [Candidatus Nealsonbacteria bacterium]